MNLIEELRRARSAPKVILFRLLFDYKPSGGSLHAFFEGQEEESYYANFLTFYLPSDYELFSYRCNGKSAVYAIYSSVDFDRFESRRLLFFVDQDYSAILHEEWPVAENIYVTGVYSIENYVVSGLTLRRYLRDILHLDEFVDDERALVQKFEEQLNRFHKLMIGLVAWIVYLRQGGFRPNISDIKLGRLVSVSPDLEVSWVTPKRGARLAYLNSATGVSTPVGCWRSLLQIARRLRRESAAKQYVRGKFELWFFVEFATRIPGLLNRSDVRGSRRVIVRTQMNARNAMEILAPRAQMPESLKLFLDHNFARLPH